MFKKRIEIWQNYRNEIFNQSVSIDNPLSLNNKWNSLIKDIKNLNPSIIKCIDINNILKLPFVFKINDNIDSDFEKLNFQIKNSNQNIIDKLSSERNEIINNNIKSIFSNQNENVLSTEYTRDMINIENNQLQKINIQLKELENNIKYFSSNASNKLKSLCETINEAKNFKKSNLVSLSFSKINNSFNYKWIYWIIIILLLVLGIVAIALIVCFLV